MRVFVLVSAFSIFGAFSLSAQDPEQSQKAAQTALQAQMSQDGRDCLNGRTTAEQNECIAKTASITQNDFEIFYNNLLSLVSSSESSDRQALIEAQHQWELYRDKTCDAIGQLYRGGSIQFSALTRCRITLLRSPMRDLDTVYHTVLHN